MKRVLHVHTLPVWSGSGINTYLNMRDMQSEGFVSELACAPGGRLTDAVEAAGMAVQPVRYFCDRTHPVKDVLAVFELVQIIRRGNYDLVHTHNSKAGFIGRLAARLVHHPAVVHTIHGFSFHDRAPILQRKLFIYLERLAAGWCHGMIAISDVLVSWAEEVGIRPKCPIHTIYSGIEVEEFQRPVDRVGVRRGLGLRETKLVIGVVAKLWEGKGHADLIRAVSLLHKQGHEVQLLVAGEGPLEADLRKLSGDLGVAADVVFAGFRTDIPELTEAVDIAVLPSHFEGMGRVLLEAMARGKPVVATTVGGIPEIVLHEKTGILVPPGNAEQLAGALERLICDRALRSELGHRGRDRIDDCFSSRRMVEETAEVYRQVLACTN